MSLSFSFPGFVGVVALDVVGEFGFVPTPFHAVIRMLQHVFIDETCLDLCSSFRNDGTNDTTSSSGSCRWTSISDHSNGRY